MEAIGRLAGGIAHDFNNLLTAIRGYADLAAATVETPEGRSDLEEITHAADRAAALTQRLLAFSRRQPIAPQPLDLNEIVADTDSLLRRLIGADVELVTLLEDSLPWIEADRAQLEQVLLNLAVNARDAMPAGGTLVIATTSSHPGGEHVTLEV